MEFCHVTVYVENLDESLRFYRDLVGLPVKRRFSPGPGVEIVFLGSAGPSIELIYDRVRTDISVGKDICLGFAVASVQETAEFFRQNGFAPGEVLQPSPQVKFFFVSDPNGLSIEFIENLQ